MARGQKTPLDVAVEFRRHYLITNNAGLSASRVGLPERTGWDLARAADADPAFAEARQKLLARGHEAATLGCLEALEVLMQALREGPLMDSMGSPIDRRAEQARAVVAIRDSLDRTAARVEARDEKRREIDGGAVAGDGTVTINLHLKPDALPCPQSTSSLPAPSPEPTG